MQQIIEDKHGLKNVTTIYNSINIEDIVSKSDATIELNFEYIIAVGQYATNVKQFDKLIEAYAKSKLPEQNMALVILGEGQLQEQLISVAKAFKVEHLVHFSGFKSNPFKYIKRAKFFVLSSELEGLPMVLLEALACGTPVVSFNCPTGPEEVITHGENGLLIEHQNIEALTQGINTMMLDTELYKTCKANAFKTASPRHCGLFRVQCRQALCHGRSTPCKANPSGCNSGVRGTCCHLSGCPSVFRVPGPGLHCKGGGRNQFQSAGGSYCFQRFKPPGSHQRACVPPGKCPCEHRRSRTCGGS